MRLNVAPTPERLKALLDSQHSTIIKGDATLAALETATPAQIDAWIDAQVNSLADVLRVLKLVLKIVILLWRRK